MTYEHVTAINQLTASVFCDNMKYHTRQMFRGNRFIILSTGTEMIMKVLTTRLSSTQQDLDVLTEQLSGRNGGLMNLTYSTPSHMSKLRARSFGINPE